MDTQAIERARTGALADIERAASRRKAIFLAAAALEAGFLVTILLLMDFKDRTHVLILLAAVMVYTLLAIGMFALGAHVSLAAARVLRSVELHAKG